MSISINGNGITSANIADGAITNADIADAAITNAKLASGGGLYASVAIICDQKSSGTSGGTFTSGAWRTRDLNTEVTDVDGIVSIASNRFTLQAGTYTINWSAPGYGTYRHKSKLRDITTSSDLQIGTSAYTSDADNVATTSIGAKTVTITSAHIYEVQHRCQQSEATDGYGVNGGSSTGSVVEIYTTVIIHKHS